MTTTSLPKASTATPDHAGLACLRASTTGLLCFYSVDATAAILSHLIPFVLLQFNQEDINLKMEGPLLSSLEQFASTISIEEDSDTFRTCLLDQASNHQFQLTGAALTEILDRDPIRSDDLMWTIGCLKWMLTPPTHKRDHLHYATRSLRV